MSAKISTHAALRLRPQPDRQRDVGDLGGETRVESGALELGLARLERFRDARLQRIDGGAVALALVGG
jgi:hypothetical protein